jgi:poly(hydroxyalkanoate) granule-associated protein
MFDLFKKTVLMGLGAMTITKEKAENLVDELIKKGELAKDKRSKAIQDLLEKANEQEKEIFDKIGNAVNKSIEKLGIPTKQDFERLEKKIDELKKK